MDINKIFDLFESSSIDEVEVNSIEPNGNAQKIKFFNEYKNHPVVWVGMFHKLIMNHTSLNSSYLTVFKTTFPTLDINDIKMAGEFIIYTKAYEFLNNLDIKRELDLKILKSSSNIQLLTALKLALSYFEEHEEWVKCAFILQIKNIVEEYLI